MDLTLAIRPQTCRIHRRLLPPLLPQPVNYHESSRRGKRRTNTSFWVICVISAPLLSTLTSARSCSFAPPPCQPLLAASRGIQRSPRWPSLASRVPFPGKRWRRRPGQLVLRQRHRRTWLVARKRGRGRPWRPGGATCAILPMILSIRFFSNFLFHRFVYGCRRD